MSATGIRLPRLLVVLSAAIGLVLALCTANTGVASTSASLPETTSASSSTAATITSPPTATTTPPIASDTSSTAVVIATGFLEARQERRIDHALSYVSASAVLDWGPGKTNDTFAAGLLWEDAFGVDFSLIECTTEAEDKDSDVTCTLATDTAVAAAVGNEGGNVCVAVAIEDDLITRVELLGAMEGCSYQFWGKVFVPFNTWVIENHPESDPTAMYNDRLSPEGLSLWDLYTQEFLEDHR